MLAVKGLISTTENMLQGTFSKLSMMPANLQTAYSDVLSAHQKGIDKLKAKMKHDYELAPRNLNINGGNMNGFQGRY